MKKYYVATAKGEDFYRTKRALTDEVNEFMQGEGYRPHGDLQFSTTEVREAETGLMFHFAQPMIKDE